MRLLRRLRHDRPHRRTLRRRRHLEQRSTLSRCAASSVLFVAAAILWLAIAGGAQEARDRQIAGADESLNTQTAGPQEPQNHQTTGAPESSSYRIDRLSVVSGGTLAASPNYTTRAVFGQMSPDGAASACAAGTVSGFGFWSVLGARRAPIVLTVASSDTEPHGVQLSWSGVEELFAIYRASVPQELVDPQNLHDETAACGVDLDETTAGDIVYYRVVAAQAKNE